MMKMSRIILIVLVGIVCVPNAIALVSEFVLPGDPAVSVFVASTVEEMSPGEFLYTYQVRGIGDLNIISLSVPFLTSLTDGSLAGGAEVEFIPAEEPEVIYWGLINSPAVAAFALYDPQYVQDGITTEYQFKSIYGAHEITGFVDEAQAGSLYGALLAPIPEPTTLSVLAIGAGILFSRRREKQ